MLQEVENKPNKNEQRSNVLNQENKIKDNRGLALWKRGVLLAIGIIGMNLIALLLSYIYRGIPRIDRSVAVNLLTYSLMFVAMITVVMLDIPKFLYKFKGWKPYVFAIAFAVGITMFNAFYTTIVSYFYPIKEATSGNESGIREIINAQPVACIFIIGIIGPLCEELAYRVGLFGLLKRVNRVLAYIVAALVFGFLHFDFQSTDIAREFVFLPTYVVPGVLFCLAYDLFGLPCSWTAHAMNNVTAVLLQIARNLME